jgi:hypothetical protein
MISKKNVTPAMNCPHNYNVDGCCHPDISDANLKQFQEGLPSTYKQNMEYLLAVRTTADYKLL